MKIPKRVEERFAQRLKHFQSIASSQKSRDVAEADTVTLVKDILAEMFGYDKYHELTSEQQIRGTFCDLAVKIEGKIRYLIEVKSAGLELNDAHLRQALNYGVGQGIEWVILTNGIVWKTYRIRFSQPYEYDEVTTFDILSINPKDDDDLGKMFLICREAIQTDALSAYHEQIQTVNKFTISQIILADSVLGAIRKEMRKAFPDLKVETDQIKELLESEILKREVVEGDKVKEAQLKIKKALAKIERDQAKLKQASSESNKRTEDALTC